MKLAKILICLVLVSSALGKPLSDKNGDANIQPGIIENFHNEETVNLNETKLIDYDEPEKEASTAKSFEGPISKYQSQNDEIKSLRGEIPEGLNKNLKNNNFSAYVTAIAAIVLFIVIFIIIFICLSFPCCCCSI